MWVISDLRVSISIHNGTDTAIEEQGFYLLQSSQGRGALANLANRVWVKRQVMHDEQSI